MSVFRTPRNRVAGCKNTCYQMEKHTSSQTFSKAEKTSALLIHNQEATYSTLKQHLLKHIGPSTNELCNIVHSAVYGEFKDKKETEKLQHAKFIAERYFLGTGQTDDANIHHMTIRLYKFHCNKRFAHAIKLSKAQTMAEVLELTSSFDSQIDYDRTKSDRPHTTIAGHITKRLFVTFARGQAIAKSTALKSKITPNLNILGKTNNHTSVLIRRAIHPILLDTINKHTKMLE